MVRSRETVRLVRRGFRQAAVFTLSALMLATACAGRSISRGDDDNSNTDDSTMVPVDDDDLPGVGGTGGSDGGVGAVGNAGTSVSGGAFPMGGTFPSGGTFPTGGTIGMAGEGSGGLAGSAMGGTSPCGGRAGDPVAGTGGERPVNMDPECKGIRSNMPCPTDGKICPNLPCGLADAGRRQCACATNWACTSCDFSSSSWVSPPCNIQPCPDGVADEVSCTTEHTVCGPQSSGEYCACWLSPTDGLSWDCDTPPGPWGL